MEKRNKHQARQRWVKS